MDGRCLAREFSTAETRPDSLNTRRICGFEGYLRQNGMPAQNQTFSAFTSHLRNSRKSWNKEGCFRIEGRLREPSRKLIVSQNVRTNENSGISDISGKLTSESFKLLQHANDLRGTSKSTNFLRHFRGNATLVSSVHSQNEKRKNYLKVALNRRVKIEDEVDEDYTDIDNNLLSSYLTKDPNPKKPKEVSQTAGDVLTFGIKASKCHFQKKYEVMSPSLVKYSRNSSSART